MSANRIRLARQASSLSLQQLAERMAGMGSPITKAALSNYETGKTVPGAHALEALASALGTSVEFLQRPDWEDFSLRFFTRLEPLSAARMAELIAYIQVEIERFLSVSDLLEEQRNPVPHSQTYVHAGEWGKIRTVCETVRRLWEIGGYAIPSVSNLLELHDWLLFSLPYNFGHINFSGMELSRGLPFVFYTPTPFLDEFRLVMLQELGRLYLSFEPEEEWQVLSYFARELLYPQSLVERDFGQSRTRIMEGELSRAKQKYGIARRNVMLRLKELNIITDAYYNSFLLHLNQNSFMRRENRSYSALSFYEEPTAYTAKLARAKAEGLLPDDFGNFFINL